MAREMGVCAGWIYQGGDRNAGCYQSGRQHAGNKNITRLSVEQAAFLSAYGDPDRDKPHSASDDMHDHQ
jgi:hypothetical protein